VQDHPIERDQVGRAVGIVGLAAIALIHLLDAVSKYGEAHYIFFLYIVLMVSTLTAAAVLLRLDSRSAWSLAVLATAATLIAYVLSRTTGLPQASQDIGNWSDSLGLASVFVEGCTLLLGAYKLLTILPSPLRGMKEGVDKARMAHRTDTPSHGELVQDGDDREVSGRRPIEGGKVEA
jgi:hypothetical protein